MAERVKVLFLQLKKWALPNLSYFKRAAPVDTPEEHLTKTLGKYESYVFKIQSILKWDNPLISVLCIFAANIIFWIVINFECRFYGLLFTLVLFCVLYDVWIDKIWPEISIPVEKTEPEPWTPQHPSGVLSVPEISHYISRTNYVLRDYYIYMKTLRAEQPGVFCVEMCVVFGMLAVIGRTVPGAVLSYCVLMAVLVGPGLFIHVLPRSTVDRITGIASGFRSRAKESDSEVDELLPDGSEANMALFQEALEGDASDKEDTNEFGLDADSSGQTSSAMKGDGSMDTLDEFELPSLPPTKRSAPHTDSDEEEDPGIHFRSSHFNGDSSSDEEEAEMTQGLAFPDLSRAEQAKARQAAKTEAGQALLSGLAQNLTSYVGAMGTSLISTVMTRAAATDTSAAPRRRRSSSDSNEEFEIINREDVS